MVKAVMRMPVRSPTAKLIGIDFKLANGDEISGYGGNVSCHNSTRNEQFLTLSFFLDDRIFHLARYFDDGYEENGPAALAKLLLLAVEDVFPIRYDFTPFCLGAPEILKGCYPAEPRAKLSLSELTKLAVPILPNYQIKQEERGEIGS